ncbi:hypothetical protein [Flavobacterium adhaerens]|uniref:hypothetical protein n=1 Tax=Flavobacterium adhaerens TaxID=3149043 RepID=UPI0032B57A9A
MAYTFPKDLTTRMHLQNLKVFASVRNVGTWAADWEYFGDPETGGLATRMFNIGLNITL